MKATGHVSTIKNLEGYSTISQKTPHTRLKGVLMHILIIGLTLIFITPAGANVEFKNSTYTITFEVNDTVFIDNQDIYIDCKPHTIYKDGYVFFNFTFKRYTGNADIYLGFTDDSYPTNISLFNGKKYIKMRNKIENVEYNFDDKNYWHFINNVVTVKNNSVRIWINVSEGIKNGKYDFAIAPTGNDISDNVIRNNFYVLDPYYITWYNPACPCGGECPCNRLMFIDLGNKKFLYLQSTYLCGDVTGDGCVIPSLDGRALFLNNRQCNPPIINYEILDYNNYVGTNIIRPRRSPDHDN